MIDMIVDMIVELFGGIRATVFAGLMLVAAVFAGVQTWRYDGLADKYADLQAQELVWRQANASNVQAIADLKLANKAWADIARATERKAAEAVAAVAGERDALAAELERRRRERGKIYEADKDAAAWGRQPVPDSIARQLRE